MTKIKTTHDGWNCVPQLIQVADLVDTNKSIIYEINNCVRESDLRDIVSELRNSYAHAISLLDDIDVDAEYETEQFDDDDDYYDMRSDVG